MGVSEEEVEDVLKNLGDELVEAISDPITWQILRDPVKAADGFTYERRSSSVIQKVKVARAARGKIQKHWRGFRVRKGISQLRAELALVNGQMKHNQSQISGNQEKLSALEKRQAEIVTAL